MVQIKQTFGSLWDGLVNGCFSSSRSRVFGSAKLIGLFIALILCCGDAWGEEVTWKCSALGSSTLNGPISGTINEDITFESSKGAGNGSVYATATAYNKDGSVRLYYHNSGNGSDFSLKPNEGVTITKVVVSAQTSTAVKYSIDGATAVDGTMTGSSKPYILTIEDIEATSSVKITNANTTNQQLQITSIVITYTKVVTGGSTTYTLTYDANKPAGASGDVTGLPDAVTGIASGTEQTLSTDAPALDGYTFVGWGTTATATETVSTVTVNTNTTVYAIWQETIATGTTFLEFDFSSLDRLFTDAACTTKASSGSSNTITTFYYRENETSPIYEFTMASANSGNSYFIANSSIISAFFGKQDAYMIMPQVAGYKITKIVTTASAGCASGSKIAIKDTEELANTVCAEQEWGNSAVCTYTIPAEYQASQLRLVQTANNKNVQISKIKYYLIEDTETPIITASNLNLGNVEQNAIVPTGTITVTGTNLTDAITYTLNAGESSPFTVTGTLTATGGTLTVALKSTATKGNFSDELTLTSGTTTKTITLTAKVTGTYSVTEIITEAEKLNAGESSEEDMTTIGYIKAITSAWSTQYDNITFNIADAMDATQSFVVYRAGAADGTTGANLKVGDKVSVTGKITNYSGTLEYATGAKVAYLNEVAQMTITATSADTEMGSVTGAGTYGYNVEVTLTATPETGYEFVNWKENGEVVAGVGAEYTFNATADRTLMAHFQAEGASTVAINATPDYAYRGSVSGADNYAIGTDATLTATPKTGYQFVNWTESDIEVSTDAIYTFTVTTARTLVANFAVKPTITVSEALTIASALAASAKTEDTFTIVGYVTAVSDKNLTLNDTPTGGTFVAFNPTGYAAAQVGDKVQVVAQLTNYSGTTPESTGGTLTISEKAKFTLTITATEHGSVTANVASGTQVERGETVTLTIAPEAGYRLVENSLQVMAGADAVTVTDNSFAMPLADVTISAAFELIPESKTITFVVPTGATAVASMNVPTGNVTLPTANVPAGNDGWAFYGWTTAQQNDQVNAVPANTTKKGTTYNLTDNVTLYALYVYAQDKGYRKVTENLTDWTGQYLIVCESQNVAFDGSLETLDAANNNKSVTINNSKVESATDIINLDDISFTIAANSDAWSIQSASGKYIGNTGTKNGLSATNDVIANAISIATESNDNNNVTITSGSTNYLRYNKANDNKRFRYFNSNSQEQIQLYRKSEKETFAFTPAAVAAETHTITYAAGAEGVTNMPTGTTLAEGASYTISTTVPAREGYTFLGWKLDGVTTLYHAGDEITIGESDLEFYAQWRSENVIIFDFTDADELTAWGIKLPAHTEDENLTKDDVQKPLGKDLCVMTYTDGGTPTRIHNNNGNYDLRIYKAATGEGNTAGSLTFTMPADYTITTIQFDEETPIIVNAQFYTTGGVTATLQVKKVTIEYTKTAPAKAVVNVPEGGVATLTMSNLDAITIAPNGTLNVGSATTITGNLILQANDGNKPEMLLNAGVTVSGDVYFEWTVKTDKNYVFALPFEVAWGAIEYWNENKTGGADWDDNFNLYITEYDSQSRADNGVHEGAGETTNWKYSSASTPLQANKGYVLNVPKANVGNAAEVTLRFKLTTNTTLAAMAGKGIATQAYTSTESDAKAEDAGWNFIGNPYFETYKADLTGAKYTTVPNLNGTGYNQYPASANPLKPFTPFFVQVSVAGDVTFAAVTRSAMPALYAENDKLFAELTLGNDHAGILMSDRYTTTYEINADLYKMMGAAQTTALYTVQGATRLAYNALPDAAAEAIPVGFSVPAAGEYTIDLADGYSEGFEHLFLTDKATNSVTDLLSSAYTFTTTGAEVCNEARFELNAVRRVAEDVTGIEAGTLELLNAGTHKLLLDGKVYIVRDGVWYDVMGKRVSEK